MAASEIQASAATAEAGEPETGGRPAAPAVIADLRVTRICVLRGYQPRVFDRKDDFLTRNGFRLVDDPADADILIGRELKVFKLKLLRLNRVNVLWTKEPYHDFNTARNVTVAGRTVHVFNVFNGSVYTDNYFDLPKTGIDLVRSGSLNAPFDDRRIVGVMSSKMMPMIVDGEDRSLLPMRERIALAGHAAGGLDIYGGNWPEGVSKGEDRTKRHHKTLKRRILLNYNFCFCPENCCSDYYITEKLWEAVLGRCLPIYYANDTIRQAPFVDAAILIDGEPGYEAIAAAVENIGEKEYVERLNTLIAGVNRAIRLGLGIESNLRTRRLLAAFLKTAI